MTTDFQLGPRSASLELSATGIARCGEGRKLVRAVLALQQPESAAPDHDPDELARAMVAGWERQKTMDQTLGYLDGHQLARIADEPSECGSMFWFEAERANCSGECGFLTPDALRFKLVFAGYPENSFLNFRSALDFQGEEKAVVGIDPTYGLNLDENTCAPYCTAACTKLALSLSGCQLCCFCSGTYGTFVRSPANATVWTCEF